jgi:hemolysin activation/secretion protein
MKRLGLVAPCALLFAAVAQGQSQDAGAPAAAPFDVLEFRVLGNSALPAITIERTVYPFLGENKTIADVGSARQALERAYRDAGYGTVYVDIPEQDVNEGVVRLRATEGRIDRVRVTGARYFSNGAIREKVPALASGAVPNLPAVQEELQALNARTPDRNVTPILKAGRTPGSVDVELKVVDELPLHGSVQMDDRYTADTSRLRASVTLSYDNLFQRQQSLSLQYQTSPQDTSDVSALVGTYIYKPESMPSTTFAAYAVDSDTDIATLNPTGQGSLSVLGNGRIYGLRAIHSLEPGVSYYHNVTFGLDYKDFLENLSGEGGDAITTPISYLLPSVTYGGTKRTDNTMTNFSVGANFALRGVASDSENFANKRFKGRANAFYVRASAQHLRQLPWTMQFFTRLGGQFTQDPLVSNEQFNIGGVDTVRGYLEASELGDYGASGTVELRTDALARAFKMSPGATYLFAFYDAGIVAILDPLKDQKSTANLASWGFGWRINSWHGLDLALDWARAIDDAGTVEAGDSRLHFLVKYGF